MRAKLIRRASDPLFRRTMRYNNSSLFNWQTGGAIEEVYIYTIPRNRKENASADREWERICMPPPMPVWRAPFYLESCWNNGRWLGKIIIFFFLVLNDAYIWRFFFFLENVTSLYYCNLCYFI